MKVFSLLVFEITINIFKICTQNVVNLIFGIIISDFSHNILKFFRRTYFLHLNSLFLFENTLELWPQSLNTIKAAAVYRRAQHLELFFDKFNIFVAQMCSVVVHQKIWFIFFALFLDFLQENKEIFFVCGFSRVKYSALQAITDSAI